MTHPKPIILFLCLLGTLSTNAVAQGNILSVSGTVVHAHPLNDFRGSISLAIAGGVEPIDIAWSGPNAPSFGDGFRTVTDLEPGTYYVTVSDHLCQEITKVFDVVAYQPCGFFDQIQWTINPCVSPPTIAFTGFPASTTMHDDLLCLLSECVQVDDNGQISFETAVGMHDFLYLNHSDRCYDELFDVEALQIDIHIPDAQLHVSSCGATDGSIIFRFGGPTGGMWPYTYAWSNGATTLNIENLSEGDYALTVTDATGCTATRTFGVYSDDTPILTAQVIHPCEDLTNGAVFVAASNHNNSTAFEYTWNTGDQTPGIDLIGPGLYTLTVTDLVSNCSTAASYTLETIPSEGDLGIVDVMTDPACVSALMGRIELNVGGGNPPYFYVWSNGVNGSGKHMIDNLPDGTYSVVVRDACGREIDHDVVLEESPTSISFDYDLACGAVSGLTASATGTTGPYSYLWSHERLPTSVTEGVVDRHCVIATDSRGCHRSECMDVQVPSIDVLTETTACEGINDGIISFLISNPSNEAIQVVLDDVISIPLDWDNGHVAFVAVTDLYGGHDYVVEISVGSCVFSHTVHLDEEALDLVFSHLDTDNVCHFDEYCNGSLIVSAEQGGQTENAFFDTEGADGGGVFNDCRIPIECNSEVVENRSYPKLKIKAFAYRRMLLAALAGTGYNSTFLQRQLQLLDWLNPSACEDIKYCTANLGLIGDVGLFGGTDGVEALGNGCYKIYCNFPLNDYEFCVADILPSHFFLPDEIDDGDWCDAVSENVYNLAILADQLSDRFGTNFTNSSLKAFLDAQADRPEAKCGRVYFCLDDFRYLADDLDEVECVQFDPVLDADIIADIHEGFGLDVTSSCEVVSTDAPTGHSVVICKRKYCPITDLNCYDLSIIYGDVDDLPSPITFTSDDDPVSFKVIRGSGEDESLMCLSNIVNDGRTFYKGMAQSSSGACLLGGAPGRVGVQTKSAVFDDQIFLHQDWDLDAVVSVHAILRGRSYGITYENGARGIDWVGDLEDDEGLQIAQVSADSSEVRLSGTHTGVLSYDGTVLHTAENASVFHITLSEMGQVLSTRVIGGFDTAWGIAITSAENRTDVIGLSTDDRLLVDGQEIDLTGTRQIVQVHLFEDGSFEHTDVMNFEGEFQLLTTACAHEKNTPTIVLHGTGELLADGLNISVETESVVLTALDSLGKARWVQVIGSEHVDTSNIAVDIDTSGVLFAGITFSDSLRIGDELFHSEGAKDIAIVQYNSDGHLVAGGVYGSNRSETIGAIKRINERVLFGGTIEGGEAIQLGALRVRAFTGTHHSAFMSYVPIDSLQSISSNHGFASTPVWSAGQHGIPTHYIADIAYRLFPSPFYYAIYVEFEERITQDIDLHVYDIFGHEVKYVRLPSATGRHRVNMDNELPSGTYIVEMRIADASVRHKILKNN